MQFCDEKCYKLYIAGKFSPDKATSRVIRGVNTSCTGAISEFAVTNDLLAKGYYVFRSVSASAPFDLIAYRGDTILKIEVKTSRVYLNTGAINMTTSVSGQQDIIAYSVIDEGYIVYLDKDRSVIELKKASE